MTPNPLTPTEHAEVNAALKAACAELDTDRLHNIEFCERMESIHDEWRAWATKQDDDYHADEYLINRDGRHLAARTLAQQMAARL